jgi:hypothetical protein
MATLEYNGQQLQIAEDWRVGELIEAENALKIDMETARGGGKMALIAYITIRRHDADTKEGVIADAVLRMELSAISGEAEDDEGDAGPPDEEGDGEEAGNGHSSETAAQQTTGRPRSEALA